MTQEEKAKAYDEAIKKAKEIKEKIVCSHLSTESCKAVSEYIDTIIPELRESEDERIRRKMIEHFKSKTKETWCNMPVKDIIAYLEKQKERGPFTKEEEYILHRIIEYLEDETCPPEWISLLHDIYCLPYEKQKEQKPSDLSEMMVHKEPYIAPVSTPMVADEQKPAEWSEEDEDRIRQIERIAQQAGCTQKLQEEIHDWLKSLRPSWKPSEEQNEPEYYQHFDPDLLAMTNAELIAKIKAEIERRIKECEATYPKDKGGYWFPEQEEAYAIAEEYKQLLSFLDTLESEKPMNLEEELEEEIEKKYDQEKWGYVDGFGSLVMDKDQFIRIARHFAQWGSEHLKK